MKVLNERYELVDVQSIAEHPQNPRAGNEQEIDASIRANKFYGACVVQASTRYVIVGNHRFRRYKATGAEKIPVFMVDVDDETAIRIMLADNRTRDMAKDNVDEERLHGLLDELSQTTLALAGSGYVNATLERLREEAVAPPPPDDEDQDFAEVTKCQIRLGTIKFDVSKAAYDVWINRLMRDNSYNTKAVARAVRRDLQIL